MSKRVDISLEKIGTSVFRLTILLFLILFLTACGSGSSSKTVTDSSTGTDSSTDSNPPVSSGELLEPQAGEGYAQKGPFQAGALATITMLDMSNNGAPTGGVWTAETAADGLIYYADIPNGIAMVTVEGNYFNEFSGAFSTTPLRLRGIMEVGEGAPPSNVNLFTHLAARYIEYWTAEGYDYEEYRDWANWFFEQWFGFKTTPDQLNILDNRGPLINNDSKTLLLYSAAASKIGMTQAQLDQLADDFAQLDGGYLDAQGNVLDNPIWPEGSGFDLMRTLFAEVDENGETLYTQARNNLQQEYGRFFASSEWGGHRAVGGYCGFAQVLCTDTWLEPVTYSSAAGKEIPIRLGLSGSYAILARHQNSSGLSFAMLPPEGTGTTLHSKSAGVNSFTELFIRPLAGRSDYLLRISGGQDPTINSVSMRRLSDGIPDEPVPLYEGDNDAYLGTNWGTWDNTNSYYQILVQAGVYEVTVSGYPCGQTITPLAIWAYYWDHDMTEPLPVEVTGQNPFENSGQLLYASGSTNVGCAAQFTLTAPGTRPNRLYLRVKAEALRGSINNESDINVDYNIRVVRQ